jgi:hypothetical protein
MSSYCLFQEPWWLDAVSPGQWLSLEARRGDELAARMPIVLRRKYGLRIIRQPPLTPMLGPWVRSAAGARAKDLSAQRKLFDQIIDQLPEWDYFEANFHHRIADWLPFYWRGFKQTTLYTYVLQDTSSTERLWRGLRENVRRNIRNAEKRVSIRVDLSLDAFLDLAELTFARQKRNLPFERALFHRIDAACAARGARQMFFAEDAEGRLHAAIYLVADAEYVYYLLGGADPRLRSSGAQILLLWEAIKYASEIGRRFDFEGSMIEPIERVFRAFGAVQVPYMQVYAARPLADAILHLLPRRLVVGAARRLR